MTSKDIDRIFEKTGQSRYRYFVKTVCKEEEVWGLVDKEGWLMLQEADETEKDVLVVFPNDVFAIAFRKEYSYDDMNVESLDVYEFVEWLDDLEEKGASIAVFPNLQMECAVISPKRLKDDFQAEFDKEED